MNTIPPRVVKGLVLLDGLGYALTQTRSNSIRLNKVLNTACAKRLTVDKRHNIGCRTYGNRDPVAMLEVIETVFLTKVFGLGKTLL